MVPRPQYTAGEPCAAERRTEGTTTLASCRWRQCSRRWVSGGVVEWRFEVPEPKKVENVGRWCLLAVANECKASKEMATTFTLRASRDTRQLASRLYTSCITLWNGRTHLASYFKDLLVW